MSLVVGDTQQLCYYATPDDAIEKICARLRATPFYATFYFLFFRIRNKTEKKDKQKKNTQNNTNSVL